MNSTIHSYLFFFIVATTTKIVDVDAVNQLRGSNRRLEERMLERRNNRPLKRHHLNPFRLDNPSSNYDINEFIAELDTDDDHDDDKNIKTRDLYENEELDVVIIGAGWAGISAANRLKKLGITNFKVLEARDYIGGRSNTEELTVKSGDTVSEGISYPFDMGSSWIVSHEGNPISHLSETFDIELGIDACATDIYKDEAKGVYNQEEFDQIYDLYEGFDNFAWKSKNLAWNQDTNLQDVADNYQKKWKFTNEEDGNENKKLLNVTLRSELVTAYGANLKDLSLSWHHLWGDDYSGYDAFVKKGFGPLIEAYAKPVEDKVELNFVVTEILRESESVHVFTDKGDEIKAKRAIVTVPLGVLKKESITFIPELPDTKRKAIKDIGMGLLNKIVLVFKEEDIFWPKNEQWLLSVPSDDAGAILDFYSGYSLTGYPYLVGFVGGDDAWMMESKKDEEYSNNLNSDYDLYTLKMKDAAMKALKNMFGDGIPKEPELAKATAWGDDPFSYGAYSYNKAKMDRKARKQLKEPVEGRLFFAGEATSDDYYATTHGALLSGKEAADEVVNELGMFI